MRMNRLRVLVSLGLIIGLVLASAEMALAHTAAVSFSPEPKATLIELPHSIVITFNEELLVLSDKETSSISVTDKLGMRFDMGSSVVEGRTLSVDVMVADTSGVIEVNWRAVAQDGHPVKGAYFFSVAPSVMPSPTVVETQSPPLQTAVPTTTQESAADDPSYIQFLILGATVLVGLAALLMRRRRNSGD